MLKQEVIYSLIDPRDNGVRYIGKTSQVPRRRLGRHLSEDTHTAKSRWVQRLGKLGLRPTLEILEWVSENDSWQEREKWWISWGRMCGWDLMNLTDGGDGPRDGRVLSKRTLEKMSLRMSGKRNPMYGKCPSAEARKRMSDAGKGKPKSEAHNLAVSIAKKGRPLSEKHKFAIGVENPVSRTVPRGINRLNRARGERHPRAKLTEREVVDIRRLYDNGRASQRMLAGRYNVSRGTIVSVVKRKTWVSV